MQLCRAAERARLPTRRELSGDYSEVRAAFAAKGSPMIRSIVGLKIVRLKIDFINGLKLGAKPTTV
jgi:hypothetical protein